MAVSCLRQVEFAFIKGDILRIILIVPMASVLKSAAVVMRMKMKANSVLIVSLLLMFLRGLTSSSVDKAVKVRPEFLDSVPNVTVAVGRDAVLPCVVKNLLDYKVAFIHLDRQMIVTIHNHVITRIPRFEIAHDKHHTWSLHINNVQQEDKGHYMCQINTDPMISKVGYLNVVVPPNIVDLESSPSMVSVRENHNASLVCKAEGTPQPKIKWLREDEKPIIIKRKKKEGKKEKRFVHGEVLDLIRISRTEMGAYLCIAQNGVPPSISKRIILTVEFSPMIWIPNQLVGAPVGTTVKLECHTESSPKAISYWAFNDSMVLNSDRFKSDERHHSEYKLDSALIIKELRREDFGSYRCISKNSLGETDGTIMLYELEAATKEAKLDATQRVETVPTQPEYEHDYKYNEEIATNVIDISSSFEGDEDSRSTSYDKPSRYNRKKQQSADNSRRKQNYWQQHQNKSSATLSHTSSASLYLAVILAVFIFASMYEE